MLVIKVDMVGSKTAQRVFRLLTNGRGLAVQQIDRFAVLDVLSYNAEFCCQHNLITKGRKSFAQQLFIGFTIHNGGIKEGVPQVHGIVEQFDHVFPGGRFAISMIHPHATKPYGGNSLAIA